jgi:hypothetical protein
LYKYLQPHPDVFMPRKEIHFFDRKWDRGLAWYATRFEGFAGQPAVGEATPTYIADPVALRRMAETIPDARLLAILRDPVERAYSHYWMEHARGRDPRTFEAAVADEFEQRSGSPRSDYLARGRYLAQLEEVCTHFTRERLHVVLLDDLRERTRSTYAEVCRFLAIDDGFVPPRIGDRVNRFVSFRSMRLRALRRSLPSRFRIGRAIGRLNARGEPYPPMDERTRRELVEHFAPELDALAAWLDRDLSAWQR